MNKITKTFIILGLLTQVGCSTVRSTTAVGEASIFRKDKPSKFDINADYGRSVAAVEEVDNKAEIDYQYALAETYSLEGKVEKAIEGFRLVLIKDPNSIPVKLRLIFEYVKVGLVSEAIILGEEVKAQDPSHVEVKLILGGLYSTLKLYEKALEEYKNVISLNPSLKAEAYLYMAAIYAETGELKDALAFFEKSASEKNEDYLHLAYYYIGKIHTHKKDFLKAQKAYESAIKAKPDFTDAVLSLGANLEEQNKIQEAMNLYSSYQDQRGPNLQIARVLGQLYLENENYDKAYRQYEIILAEEPQNIAVKIRLALIDIDRKDYDLAIQKLKDILVIAPESDKVRFYLAAVYDEMKMKTEALEQFVQIVPESEFYSEAVVHSVYILRSQGKSQRAEKIVDEALKNKQDIPQFFALKASLLDERKKYSEANTLLAKAIEIFPENEQLLFFHGSVNDKIGNREATISSMKKVIELNENHIQALNYLAYTYAELNQNLEEAELLAKRALNLKPNDAYIIDTLGWVYFKQGKHKEALEYLERAHFLNPHEGVIAEHLGDVYFHSQLFIKAKDMYEKAAKVEKDEVNQQKIESKLLQLQKILSDGNRRSPATSY